MKSKLVCQMLLILLSLGQIDSNDWHREHGNETFKFLVQGGYRPKKHNFAKYVVSIRKGNDRWQFGSNHMCAGTIIKSDIILLAAHCVYEANSNEDLVGVGKLIVVAGTANRLKRTSTTQQIKVRYIIPHPLYDAQVIENDVALLILASKIDIDGSSRDVMKLADTQVVSNTKCTVLGWGMLFENGPLPAELVYADLYSFSADECRYAIPYHYRRGMLCAQDMWDLEKDAMPGDSGGPLICNDKVTGIVSFGLNSFIPYPGVYADVFYYRDWILANWASRQQICHGMLIISLMANLPIHF